MPKRLSQVDPRDIERTARVVPGVAFAEIRQDGERPALHVVVWHDANPEETAGRVEVALRDALGVDVEGGEVRLAGVANPGEGGGAVRIIDLGGNTWATETLSQAIPGPPFPEPIPERRRAVLVSVTVSRSADRCSARVEVDAGEGGRVAEVSGPATSARQRRAVCEAAAAAAAASLALPPVDVQFAGVVDAGEPCAVVVVVTAGDEPLRRAGVEPLGADQWHAFASAAVQAVSALAV